MSLCAVRIDGRRQTVHPVVDVGRDVSELVPMGQLVAVGVVGGALVGAVEVFCPDEVAPVVVDVICRVAVAVDGAGALSYLVVDGYRPPAVRSNGFYQPVLGIIDVLGGDCLLPRLCGDQLHLGELVARLS